jgi:dihydroorotate dehydrogenase electron transfer subunit
MKQITNNVISNEKLWGGYRQSGRRSFLSTWLMWLHCPEIAPIARPGQFVMVNCGPECTMLRPFSIHNVDKKGNLALFYAVLEDSCGTKWLSRRTSGDIVSFLGPLGNGFSIDTISRNLLLVAGGNGIAPLSFLAQYALEREYSVTLLYGTADNKRCQLPPSINLISVTEDGTEGHHGRVTDLLPEYIDLVDQVFACGPIDMYNTMQKEREVLLKSKPVQVSLEIRMGCGLGFCYACTVMTNKGLRQVCKDGPVFNLDDIIWDKLDC